MYGEFWTSGAVLWRVGETMNFGREGNESKGGIPSEFHWQTIVQSMAETIRNRDQQIVENQQTIQSLTNTNRTLEIELNNIESMVCCKFPDLATFGYRAERIRQFFQRIKTEPTK